MKIKVCGLTNLDQMSQLCDVHSMGCNIDFIGINFYKASPRWYHGPTIATIPQLNLRKVGIFVNAEADTVIATIEKHELNYIQLHGDESPSYCSLLSNYAKVIKAFSHYYIEDDGVLNKFSMCEFFVFDRASAEYGGSGKKFNWQILNNYKGSKPYLLAGGIAMDDAEEIKAIAHSRGFLGIDINSKFETKPGIKNLESIKHFIQQIKNER